MRVGTPSCGEMAALSVKMRRAVERENLANTSPVASAVSVSPVIASAVTTRLAAVDSGNSAP